MRKLVLIAVLWIAAGNAMATTLEQLSLAQMIDQSTAIVRGKVTGSFSATHNGTIYTFFHLQVLENLKSSTQPSVDVAVPGGSLNGMLQSVAGAPALKMGNEYVLFLWTSKSGLTQIIGLSQGAFDIQTSSSGDAVVSRGPASAQVLDGRGKRVQDTGTSMRLSDLRQKVQAGGAAR